MWSLLFQSLFAKVLQQLIVGNVVKHARHFCSKNVYRNTMSLTKISLGFGQVEGITTPVMRKALEQANAGRRHILGMSSTTPPVICQREVDAAFICQNYRGRSISSSPM